MSISWRSLPSLEMTVTLNFVCSLPVQRNAVAKSAEQQKVASRLDKLNGEVETTECGTFAGRRLSFRPFRRWDENTYAYIRDECSNAHLSPNCRGGVAGQGTGGEEQPVAVLPAEISADHLGHGARLCLRAVAHMHREFVCLLLLQCSR